MYIQIHMYIYIYIYIHLTQYMICVHCLIARFEKIILVIFQYKYKKSVPEDKMLQDLILSTKL